MVEPNNNEYIDAFIKSLPNNEIKIYDKNSISNKKEIGKGGYGVVYKALLNNEVEVAIKELLIDCSIEEALVEISKEISFILKAKHDRLPKMYGICLFSNDSVGLIFEFINGNSLVNVYSKLTNHEKLDIIKQLCEILNDLHKIKLIHRDIKPHNIMVEPGNKVKLIDFGVSKICQHTVTNTATSSGTTAYMAPENMDADIEDMENECPITVSSKADIWSVGCLLSELFSGNIPWGLKNTIAVENKLINKAPYPIPSNINLEPIVKLIKECTKIDPSERPSAWDLIELINKTSKEI